MSQQFYPDDVESSNLSDPVFPSGGFADEQQDDEPRWEPTDEDLEAMYQDFTRRADAAAMADSELVAAIGGLEFTDPLLAVLIRELAFRLDHPAARKPAA